MTVCNSSNLQNVHKYFLQYSVLCFQMILNHFLCPPINQGFFYRVVITRDCVVKRWFLTFNHTIPNVNNPEKKKTFEGIVEKGGNAGKLHFLLFPQCFQSLQVQISVVESHFYCHLQIPSIWTNTTPTPHPPQKKKKKKKKNCRLVRS